MRLLQTNFTGGEWSTLLDGRVDLNKHTSAVHRLENFYIHPQGSVSYRPGFRYVGTAKDNGTIILIPFVFSAVQAYILEIGNRYIRFFRNKAPVCFAAQAITNITGAIVAVVTYTGPNTYINGDRIIISGVRGMTEVNNREFVVNNVNTATKTFNIGIDSSNYGVYTDSGTVAKIYEIASPYTELDLPIVQFCQSIDILYLFHRNHAPRKLTRTDHTSWTFTTIRFYPPVTREVVFAPDATITPTTLSGYGVIINASGGTFTFMMGDRGRVIRSGAAKAIITGVITGTQVTVDILDPFVNTNAIASGGWTLAGSPNASLTAFPTAGSKSSTIQFTANNACFRSADIGRYILIGNATTRIIAVSSSTVVQVILLTRLEDWAGATRVWTLEEDAWSVTLGFPICGTFFEDRLIIAGSPSFPDTIWGSVTGDYENFGRGVNDSNSIIFTLGSRQVQVIRWIVPRDYLLLGTLAGEWQLGPSDPRLALSPTNVKAKQLTSYGCDEQRTETIGLSTVFVQKEQRKIRGLRPEGGGYVTSDLTIFAEHIHFGGFKQIAFQQEPLSILWCIVDNGHLMGLTYIQEENVAGWQKHVISGAKVINIAVIPGIGYDELWMVVIRMGMRYIEVLEEPLEKTFFNHDNSNSPKVFFVDSGLTYHGSAATTITGLWHLNGQIVSILADGGVHPNRTVVNGKITLDYPASLVQVGLGYIGTLQLMRPQINTQEGSTQGLIRRVINVIARVYRSGTFKVGRNENNLQVAKFRDPQTFLGQPSPLYTGDTVDNMGYDGEFDRDSRVMIVQDKPLPLTVTAVLIEVDV